MNNLDMAIKQARNEPYGSALQIEAFNHAFEEATEQFGIQWEAEPHAAFLLKATNDESLDYLLEQCDWGLAWC